VLYVVVSEILTSGEEKQQFLLQAGRGVGGGGCELAPGNREGEENKIIFIWREK